MHACNYCPCSAGTSVTRNNNNSNKTSITLKTLNNVISHITWNGLFVLWVGANYLNKIRAMWKVKTSPLFFLVHFIMDANCYSIVCYCIPTSAANICIYSYTTTQDCIAFLKLWYLFWVSTYFLYSLNGLFSSSSPLFGKCRKSALRENRTLILYFLYVGICDSLLYKRLYNIVCLPSTLWWYLIRNICVMDGHIASQFK